jgi:hypothetical protein
VKCWIKVAAFITLIGLLGADIGLQTALWFGAPTRQTVIMGEQPVTSAGGKQSASDGDHAPLILYTPLIVGVLTLVVIGYQTFIFRGQYAIMTRQADIADRQAGIASRQLITQGPFLEYNLCKLEVKAKDTAKTVLEDYKISLVLKNSGRDVAVNVAYWQGEIFRVAGIDDPILSDTTGEHFRKTIFRSEGLSGKMSIGPDMTADTDRITLSPIHLRALYSKRLRMFVWLVMRYGSRLQSDGWFAEVATNLEFVLDRDPDTYKLTDKLTEGLPFRVRTAGYRYRESHDQPAMQSASVQPPPPHDMPSAR